MGLVPDALPRSEVRRGMLFIGGGIWTGQTRPLWATSLLLSGSGIEAVGFEEVDDDGPTRPDPSLFAALDGMFQDRHVSSLDRALQLVTIDRVRGAVSDSDTGTIEPGKLANLMVLDRNLFSVPPEQIEATRVVAIFHHGRCVYGAASLGAADLTHTHEVRARRPTEGAR